VRRHAALSVAEEQEFLVHLEREVKGGETVTVSHALRVLRRLFAGEFRRDLIYSIFDRHGWRCDQKPGPVESPYFPPTAESESDTEEATAASRYRPKAYEERERRTSARDNTYCLSPEDEEVVLESLQARIAQGEPITRVKAQAAFSERAKAPVSRQSTTRILLRHGWRSISHGYHSLWVSGEPSNLDELKRALDDRRVGRLLSVAEEEQILAQFEAALDRGEPVLREQVRQALSEKAGRSVTSNMATDVLRRHGWKPERTYGRRLWSKGEGRDIAAFLERLDVPVTTALMTRKEETEFIRDFERRVEVGENVLPEWVATEISRRVGREVSYDSARAILRRAGWRRQRSGGTAMWVKDADND
jgi:hypothetical protein